MKKLFYLLLSAPIFLFSGCENTEIEDTNPIVEELVSTTSSPRAIIAPILGTKSKSNPTLYDDWENLKDINLNGRSIVDAPWVFQQGNSMNIPYGIRMDIKKEDGWTMLGHTLSDRDSGEPNYILFYHPKSGILKGFYYNLYPIPNQNAKWVLYSDSLSSLIPANTREYQISSETKQYATTSNLLNTDVISNIAHLNQGWNCFTFELPYGTINNKPIVHITGYNVHTYELQAKGSLSGQVVIPGTKTTNSLDGWKKWFGIASTYMGSVNSIVGAVNKTTSAETMNTPNYIVRPKIDPISLIQIIGSGTSYISNILGIASIFTSKKENVTNRYNFSGNIELTGNIVGKFGGLEISINDINLSMLNGNNALGVWGLKERPKVKLVKYERAQCRAANDIFPLILSDKTQSNQSAQKRNIIEPGYEIIDPIEDTYCYYRKINMAPHNITKQSIEINPALLPTIRDYKVSTNYVYCSKTPIWGYENRTVKIDENWYTIEIPDGVDEISTVYNSSSLKPRPGMPLPIYWMSCGSLPYHKDLFLNILVEIEYNDKSTFSSSRIFKVDCQVTDNIKQVQAYPSSVILF